MVVFGMDMKTVKICNSKNKDRLWLNKIERTKQLDCDNLQVLELGWKVLTVYECG